jgi:hypothetical protein
MKHYFFNNPIFRLVAPPIYGVIIYLLILLINNNVAQVNDLFTTQEVYVCILLSYLSFEVTRAVILLLNRLIKGKSPQFIIPVQLLATSVISVGLVALSLSLYFNFIIGFTISETQLLIFTIIFTITSLLYNTLYFSNYYLHRENTVKINTEKQHREVLEMEMMEYKNDINPDLLYESLENLIGLMYKDVEKAEDYIDNLGSAYRYVLTNRQNELISITSELEAAKNVVRLLNEKYFGQILFESALHADELDAMLIPGSLPIIIENLVRNSIITRFEPFVIRCYREEEYLTIESKLNDRLMLHEASANAFARLQKSYSIYSELPLIKVKAYDENYIKLPIIKLGGEMEKHTVA